MQFLALTSAGIEPLLADELAALGASDITTKPEGIYFQAELKTAYAICLQTRLASRILLQLDKRAANDKSEIYQAAYAQNWSNLFDHDCTFAIDFVGTGGDIRNSQFGALLVKDAVIDHFTHQQLPRPNVDKHTPQIRFQVRWLKQELAIYLDFSGRALFKRGYRDETGSAPLKENLAAALVIRSGWLEDSSKPLVDPMCGSGTLLIEAASMASNEAPALNRTEWGFNNWRGHDQNCFNDAKNGLPQHNNAKFKLVGLDADPVVIKRARQNAKNAGFADLIQFEVSTIENLANHYGESGTLLFNPPYGERMGNMPELVAMYSMLGQCLKSEFLSWRVGVFSAGFELFKRLKLSSFKRYKLKNGPLDCQLALYDISASQLQRDEQLQIAIDWQQSPLANRLAKNLRGLKNWLKPGHFNCYRVYDADIPEYNVAIDIYADYMVIQEYAPPKTIDADKAAQRLEEVIYVAPKALAVDPGKVSLKVRQKQKGKNQYQALAKHNHRIEINEYGAKLWVNLWDYLDTGLFLDHRKTRQLVAQASVDKRLLNLFCYTGSVSVQAALAGAKSVTSVDMSNTYINWAQDNFKLNGLVGRQYQFIQADCLAWLADNREKYDVIFVDPPSFSNSKRMEDSFDVQRDHIDLLRMAVNSLAANGKIIFTNNKRNFKIDQPALAALGLEANCWTEQTRDLDFKRNLHIHNSWLITRKDEH